MVHGLSELKCPDRLGGMKTLVSLVGLVLIFEGLPYVTFPEQMKDWLRQVLEMETRMLRILGLIALGIGLLLCFIAQCSGLL